MEMTCTDQLVMLYDHIMGLSDLIVLWLYWMIRCHQTWVWWLYGTWLTPLCSHNRFLETVCISQYSDSLRPGRSRDRISVGLRFSAPVQTGPGAHPASYTMGTGFYPGVKLLGCGIDHPPPSSAEVKERVGLYLNPPPWAFVACSRMSFTFHLYTTCHPLVWSAEFKAVYSDTAPPQALHGLLLGTVYHTLTSHQVTCPCCTAIICVPSV